MSHTPIVLLDGGLGTTLADQHGCKFNNSTPLWSSDLLITSPSTLLATQKSFADAGADVILTATYQASNYGFALTKRERAVDETEAADLQKGEGYAQAEAEAFMKNAVSIARQSFGSRQGSVALSLGAYGATMWPASQEYTGKYDAEHLQAEALRAWHAERLQIFRDEKTWAEVGYVAFETLPMKEEIVAVRQAARGIDRPFWISCVFPVEGNVLPDGTSVADAVELMLGGPDPAPLAIGMNCTKVWKLRSLIRDFEAAIQAGVDAGRWTWPALVMYPDGAQNLVYNTTTHEWEEREGGHPQVSYAMAQRKGNFVLLTLSRFHGIRISLISCRRRRAGGSGRVSWWEAAAKLRPSSLGISGSVSTAEQNRSRMKCKMKKVHARASV
jgi:homocysteine S-methyltransferase